MSRASHPLSSLLLAAALVAGVLLVAYIVGAWRHRARGMRS